MSDRVQLLVFRLDQQRYALPLAIVERVVRAVEVTPLPTAPLIVHGAINVHGSVLPVLNLRAKLHLQDRSVEPSDCFVIARTAQQPVVLAVDEADGVIEEPVANLVSSSGLNAQLDHFPAVLKLADGLVLIHDLERFLSTDEAEAVDAALAEHTRSAGRAGDEAAGEPS